MRLGYQLLLKALSPNFTGWIRPCSGHHHWRKSNQTSQGCFQFSDSYLTSDKTQVVQLYCHQFAFARFEFYKERAEGLHGGFYGALISGRFLKPFPQILNFVGCFHWTRSNTVTFIGIYDVSSLPKFGHQKFNCSSTRYFVSAKISPALPLCQNHRLCCKVRLYYFVRCRIILCPLLSP